MNNNNNNNDDDDRYLELTIADKYLVILFGCGKEGYSLDGILDIKENKVVLVNTEKPTRNRKRQSLDAWKGWCVSCLH